MSEEKKEWADGIGQFIATISMTYGFVKRIWSSMRIGVEIIAWLKTDVGKKEAEAAIRLLGEKYLENMEVIAKSSSKDYLHDLYSNEIIELGSDDGTKMLADAKNILKAGMDIDFFNLKFKKCSKKNKVQVRVSEIIKHGTFFQFFGSLFGISSNEISFKEFVEKYREDLRNLCIGQGQIEEFTVKHRDKLRKDGCSTFFLLENEGTNEFFVVCVIVRSVDLYAFLFRLDNVGVWEAEHNNCLVIPQLG